MHKLGRVVSPQGGSIGYVDGGFNSVEEAEINNNCGGHPENSLVIAPISGNIWIITSLRQFVCRLRPKTAGESCHFNLCQVKC